MELLTEKIPQLTEHLTTVDIEKFFLNVIMNILTAILLIIVLVIVRKIGRNVIKKIFAIKIDKLKHIDSDIVKRRKETLESLILNIWRYIMNIISILGVISIFFSIGGIVTGAGFLAVAITFAAQSLLNDITMGFFIVFEDMFSVGDLIEVNGHSGTVTDIGLRATKLQVLTGEVIILPNGSIQQVINHSVTNGKALLDINVSYETDLEKVINTLEKVADKALESYPQILERPIVLGVQALKSSEIVIRMAAEVEPLQKWHIERELRKLIKIEFDRDGIEMPFPRMVIYQKDSGGICDE